MYLFMFCKGILSASCHTAKRAITSYPHSVSTVQLLHFLFLNTVVLDLSLTLADMQVQVAEWVPGRKKNGRISLVSTGRDLNLLIFKTFER